MGQSKRRIVVVSDLDGTLLDHDNYRFEEVLPTLDRMKDLGLELVINTSKTKSEWLVLQKELAISGPFIVENGSALYHQEGVNIYGSQRHEVLQVLDLYRGDFLFKGFHEAHLEEIIEWTGLERAAALRAACREYSEPLVWMDCATKEKEFCRLIREHGMRTHRGGRFLHVLGDTDKGKPLSFFKNDVILIALGDRPNDLEMLREAQIGVIVASSDGYFLEAKEPFMRTSQTGPRGWVEAMSHLLNQIESQRLSISSYV